MRQPDENLPTISVIMANYNGAAYLREAVRSVLCQTFDALELIVVDDGSTDRSLDILSAEAERDARVRVLSSERGGPAAARNRAIDAARGEWIAIVDSDDLVHPSRFARMLGPATEHVADIVADNLICFGAEWGETLLGETREVHVVDAAAFVDAEEQAPPLKIGYVKPLIRRDAIGDARYRDDMTVGEDFDFLLRLLMSGARMIVIPEALYLYRRHPNSISHRLSEEDVSGMLIASQQLEKQADGAVATGLGRRVARLARELSYARMVALIKDRRWRQAGEMIARDFSLTRQLATSLRERFARRRQDVSPGSGRIGLASEVDAIPDGFRHMAVPKEPSDWTASRAAEVTAAARDRPLIVQASGRDGLEALGYVPGWDEAELVAPADGWTDEERRLIARLPWPVSERSS